MAIWKRKTQKLGTYLPWLLNTHQFNPCLWFKDIHVAAQRAAVVLGVHVEMLRTVGRKEANAFRPVTLHEEVVLGKVTTVG